MATTTYGAATKGERGEAMVAGGAAHTVECGVSLGAHQ